MVSKNQLLGLKVEVEVEKVKTSKLGIDPEAPKRLYRKDFPKGKVVDTWKEQDEYIANGWVESPADIDKKEAEITFESIGSKKSKTEVSKKKKGK